MRHDLRFSWLILAAVLLVGFSSPAAAAPGLWTSQGPEGGGVTSLVVGESPGVLFAGVANGVMKSVDGGRRWAWVLTGSLASGPVTLAVDPSNPRTLYAGEREGMYKSTDSGATWSQVNLEIRGIRKIAISPAAPRTVWVAGSAFYVSRDAGASWTPVGGGYPASQFPKDVAVDPTRRNIVYVSNSDGLFKTNDAGAHWTRILDNDPFTLAVDPNHPWKIYAAAFTRFYEGVLRSVDGGATWTHLTIQGDEPYVEVLAVDPRSSAVYAAVALSAPHSVFRSVDGGDTWTDVGSTLPSMWPGEFAFNPSRPAFVYLGTSAGVWKSVDRGRTWAPSSGGMAATVEAVAFAPSDPRIVYAGAGAGGFFASTNRGMTWSLLLPANLNVNGIWSLRVDPRSPATVFAATDRGLFQSLDGARTWRRLGSMEPAYDLAIDPAAPSRLYAASPEGAYRSTDGGNTWSLVFSQNPGSSSPVYHLTVSPARPSEVYLTSPSGLFTSPDRGDTWTRLPSPPVPTSDFFGVAVDPARPSILYILGERSLSKSTDGGQTWAQADGGIPAPRPMTALVIDPAHPDTLYCATWNRVYRSRDGGAIWRPLGRVFDDSLVTGLILDKSGPTTLHASTTAGVFEWSPSRPPI